MNDTGPPQTVVTLDLAGSAAKSLFLGSILEQNIFPFPSPDPDEAETVKLIISSIDKFFQSKTEDLSRYDEENSCPPEYLEELKALGLFGLIIPEEFGGIGLSSMAYARVMQQISRHDGSTPVIAGAHSSIGLKGLLLFGTEEQKAKYLPRLATGELIAAFCLTEACAGSDAAAIRTQATRNSDDSWTLSGEKIWITNGPFADFFTVFAKTDVKTGEISAFIVERAWAGVSVGPKEEKMGIRTSSTSSVIFEDVRIPSESLLGKQGEGFKMAMSILNSGRSGIGGGCVGAMKESIKRAAVQAQDRKQFGKSISEFGLIKGKISQMTVDCFAAESVVNMVAYYIDTDCEDFSVEAAICKVFCAEALWRTANEALQIAGGNGYMKEFPYEKLVRDCRINMIFEGTNEILRIFIALAGMKDAGEYLKEIGKSAASIFNDPIQGFGMVTEYAQRKLAQLTSLGRDKLQSVDKVFEHEAYIFELYTVRFTKTVEALLKEYRKEIISKQLILKRVADITIDLFVGLCVISRASQMVAQLGEPACQKEILIAKLFTQQAKRRMNQTIRRIAKNEDQAVEHLSEVVVEKSGVLWDN
ncbi:acyl-CoA dehydrogenase family protein [Oligoflexia bacterium]|nr:acyl-CoA dehydrogenase family protein [Oligoflexia bacterium]